MRLGIWKVISQKASKQAEKNGRKTERNKVLSKI